MAADDCLVLREVGLEPRRVSTQQTVHRRGGAVLAAPAALRIVQFSGDAGFYLLYLDDVGDELTDTFHDSVDAAMAQAEWEYGVVAEDWHVEAKNGAA